MKPENLVVLCFGSNLFTPVIKSLDEARKDYGDLEVDVDRGFWTYKNNPHLPIGKGQTSEERVDRVLGVYDKTRNDHLANMVFCFSYYHHPNPISLGE